MYVSDNMLKESNINDNIDYIASSIAYIFRYSDIMVADSCLNFMIIDDNKSDIASFEKSLLQESNLKFSLSKWSSAREARAAIKSGLIFPDLIILDLGIPSVDSKILLKKFKEIRSLEFVPIVILSSANNIETTVANGSLGASAFFGKPINVELFQAFVLGQDI